MWELILAVTRLQATDAALKAAEQTKASIQRLVRSVQHNILPQPEPILKEEERPMAGSLKPKLQAAPMPAPPTLVKKASAAQKQVRIKMIAASDACSTWVDCVFFEWHALFGQNFPPLLSMNHLNLN